MFYEGNINLLKESSIAIIGSRDLTDYGRKIGAEIIKDIAIRDIVVVSGMAIGADRLAHEETLNVGGKTIAVMGTGFKNIYPPENKDIFDRIIENGGLVLTEYDDEVEFSGANFPKRNRIISGISQAVLVIEAKYRSGTSITARYAWQQNKEVYAVPGRLDSKNGVGINNLIKNGAKLVTNANDILKNFDEFRNKKKRMIIQNSRVKKEYRKIYEVLDENPISLEEIAYKTNNTIKCTLKLLTLMEIEDLVKQVMGVGYVKKEL